MFSLEDDRPKALEPIHLVIVADDSHEPSPKYLLSWTKTEADAQKDALLARTQWNVVYVITAQFIKIERHK